MIRRGHIEHLGRVLHLALECEAVRSTPRTSWGSRRSECQPDRAVLKSKGRILRDFADRIGEWPIGHVMQHTVVGQFEALHQGTCDWPITATQNVPDHAHADPFGSVGSCEIQDQGPEVLEIDRLGTIRRMSILDRISKVLVGADHPRTRGRSSEDHVDRIGRGDLDQYLRRVAPTVSAFQHAQMITPHDLRAHHTMELLHLYADILEELRARGVQRSSNNPVADYGEWLVARALGLELSDNSKAGYDAVGSDGSTYQVKSRRLTKENGSRQLSTIRGMVDPAVDPFDVLVGVLFASDFGVIRAASIPIAAVRPLARWQRHVNGHRFMLTDAVWLDPQVTDITAQVHSAAT